jgi:DNA-binding transcriptional ArsR family regulator
VNEKTGKNLGWTVGQSIALELDAAIAIISGSVFQGGSLRDFNPLIQSIPQNWLDELNVLLFEAKGFRATLEILAILADVLLESDYSRATIAMRELTLPASMNRLVKLAASLNLHPDLNLPQEEQLVDLYWRVNLEEFTRVGIQPNREYQSQLRQGVVQSLRLFHGGDIHDRFWHWMDRFYYELYSHWQSSRLTVMENLEKQVITMMGAKDKAGVRPEISWLSEKNPVQHHTGVKRAVLEGGLKLCFWIEPFGLPDSWVLLPDMVVVSFATPGETVENYISFTRNLAGRVSALSDPTRLFILRMIRNIGMTNTDMADYLNLSRPTVSIHARILREAGLIRSHQEGRIMRHEIVPEEIHKLFRDLEQFLDLPEEG